MPGRAGSGPLVRTEVQALARAHWGTPLSVGDQADEGLIAEIYAGLNADGVRELELAHYLEDYLWPSFAGMSATRQHLISIVVILNKKA